MSARRVVITGQGSINPLGHTACQTMEAMKNGENGIDVLEIPDVDRLLIKIGAEVKGYDPVDHFSPKRLAFLDRFSQFALIAAREAMAMAQIKQGDSGTETAGVILGNSGGGLNTSDASYRAVYQDGKNRVHPFVVPRLMSNAAVSQLSIEFGLRGPCYSVSSACASSNHAMGQAFQMIRNGLAPLILTGGAEAMLCFGGLKAWEGLRVMSPDGCRPFCASRNGMVQGEGAAVFVFEDYEHAVSRGAVILAEVVGFGMTSDAADMVVPDQSGAGRAMQAALDDAGISGEDIGYINAHGTGTILNDKTETAAIHAVFKKHAKTIAISSTKAMHGHLIGAAGAVELLACILALQENTIAPTIGYTTPDPDCDLDYVTNATREKSVKYALSNSFAFGGLNAVIILRAI